MADLITAGRKRELDAIVAERVLNIEVLCDVGNYYLKAHNGSKSLPLYSFDIEAAYEVIENRLADGWNLTVQYSQAEQEWTALFGKLQLCKLVGKSAKSQPVAICLAALETVNVVVEPKWE